MTTGARLASLRNTLRSIALNLALVGVAFLIALVAAEALVRVIAPQQLILIRPDLWQPADTVGWLHRPNVDTEINTGERTVTVRTDERGFRVGGPRQSEPQKDVLLLGDSFMEALQVDYEASVSGLVEESLSRSLGEPIAIRNAGIGGWDPDQYLLRARSLLAESDYDLVITAIYLGNDVIAERRERVPPRLPVERYSVRLPRSLSSQEFVDAFLRPLNDFLEVRSHLFLFFKNRLQTLRMGMGLATLTFPPQFLNAEANGPRWETTADLCADIDALAREDGAASLFVLIPAPFQLDTLDLMRYVQGYGLDMEAIDIEQPNRRLSADLAARGIQVIDALPAFRVLQQSGVRLYGNVDQHFSLEGNRALADIVAPAADSLLRETTANP